MKLTLVNDFHGYSDYNVTGAGTITRMTAGENIKKGDMFNIFYGENSKAGSKWLGDAESSLRASEVFQAITIDSEGFYNALFNSHSTCSCAKPSSTEGLYKLIAVDLEYPEYSRDTCRWMVWLTKCTDCKKDVTFGRVFGNPSIRGLADIKAEAEEETKQAIDWKSIQTTRDGA